MTAVVFGAPTCVAAQRTRAAAAAANLAGSESSSVLGPTAAVAELEPGTHVSELAGSSRRALVSRPSVSHGRKRSDDADGAARGEGRDGAADPCDDQRESGT
ncbi:hypothetical protein P8C59_005903 [Phyllachora maydis]|uniref:Uncharacterized protein n=1 Tax=Phyllachora maydis TaxID=1825666 RepID=A0AAD9I5C0_9PEZI|nr:hypothetical protein P8C59_005903 [Phyllachora maydis]